MVNIGPRLSAPGLPGIFLAADVPTKKYRPEKGGIDYLNINVLLRFFRIQWDHSAVITVFITQANMCDGALRLPVQLLHSC